jgi:hypothetical protein
VSFAYEQEEGPEAEFTVITSECGAWMLLVKPEREINYKEFMDAVRTFLFDESGLDDTRPDSEVEIN